MIRIDAAWLATAPLDMRAGTDTALARVITTFGAAHPHHAYVFANQRANRLKILVHDGVGLWLAARRSINPVIPMASDSSDGASAWKGRSKRITAGRSKPMAPTFPQGPGKLERRSR